MTDTEKAKAYDLAVGRAKNFIENGDQQERTIAESIFAGLIDTFDERIRKEIVFIVKQYGRICEKEGDPCCTINDCLAYLEKIKDTEYNEKRDFVVYHPLKNGDGVYECIPYSFYGSLTSFSDTKDLLDFLHNCFSTEQECEEWIENQNKLRMGDFAMNRFVGFFEKKAKEYEINLPHRGYDIYALCVELYTFLRSQSLDTIERMSDEINARTVDEYRAPKQGLIYSNNNKPANQ